MIASVIILITLSPLVVAASASRGVMKVSNRSDTHPPHPSSPSASTSRAQLAQHHSVPHFGGGIGRNWEQHLQSASISQPLRTANIDTFPSSLDHPHSAPESQPPPVAPAIILDHSHLHEPPEHDEDYHIGDVDFAILTQFLQSERGKSIDHHASSTITDTPLGRARIPSNSNSLSTKAAVSLSLSQSSPSSVISTSAKAVKETPTKRKFDYSLLQQVSSSSSAPFSSRKPTKNLDHVQKDFSFDNLTLPTRKKIYTVISKYTDMDDDTIPSFATRRIVNKYIGHYLLSNDEEKILEALDAIHVMPILEWKRGIPKPQRRLVAQKVTSALGFNHINRA